MKGTMDDSTNEGAGDSGRRSLFRRARRGTDAPADSDSASSEQAVATVDELARRVDALTAIAEREHGDSPEVGPMTSMTSDDAATRDAPAQPAPPAPEAPSVQQPAPATAVEPPVDESDIEARLDAVLAPSALVKPSAAAQEQPAATPAAELRPTTPAPATRPPSAPAADAAPASTTTAMPQTGLADAAPTAARTLGIDVERVARLIEEEAIQVQYRLEVELRSAHAKAAEILERAEHEAERIREHGQNQARVLLGEVEEIISEAQQTGEQILQRADQEATQLRKDATAVLSQAQGEARAIVESARREGEQVLAEQRRLATVRAQEAMREQDRLKDQIRRLEERRRQVLESLEPLIAQLTQMMPTGARAEGNVVHLDRSRGGQPQ